MPKIPDTDLQVRYQAPDDLKPYAKNDRTHSKQQIAMLKGAIQLCGFSTPVLIDNENGILAGHARVEAAKALGMAQIPTICLGHLKGAERKAFIVADNRIAERAGWDKDILREELEELAKSIVELDFPFESIGFTTAEVDELLELPGRAPGDGGKDDVIPVPQARAVSRFGDLWQLGDHRLIVGDARDEAVLATLMDGELAHMVFSDPPYNVKIDGNVTGLGSVKHRDFAMACGEMSKTEFIAFLTDALSRLAQFSADGAIHFICMDWRHAPELMAAGEAAYSELKNLIIWAKTNAGMGTFYRSQHELIFAFKHGKAGHTNNFGLGENGRYRTNIWTYPGINSFSKSRAEELAMHPTVKPVALVADAIRDVSRRGELVLDSFGGSGTTMIAAEKTGRCARLIELDPIYADVICRRWAAHSRMPAILSDGRPFDEVLQERLDDADTGESGGAAIEAAGEMA